MNEMRLIDADALQEKIMMEAPDFMDGGSSITKAFIMAMIKTHSVTQTIDAIQVTHCKDCMYRVGEIDEENNLAQCCDGKWHDCGWYCGDNKPREI